MELSIIKEEAMPNEDFELKLKHLEFVQGVITRMNSNSFSMKGWMITIVAGFLAIFAASKDLNEIFLFVAIVPTLLFWILDSYYLMLERKYRKLFNAVKDGETEPFNMSVHSYKECFLSVLFSKTERSLYLVIILLLAVGGALGYYGVY